MSVSSSDELKAAETASFFHLCSLRISRWRENTEENTMKIGYRNFCVRTFTATMAAISCLGIAGCGKTPAPEEAAKNVLPPAPVAASAAKSQKAEPPRVDPAAAANATQAAAVKAAFAADSRLKSFAIDVRAANGTVELFGTVDSKSSQQKAEKIAAGVAGVKSVKSHLVLVSGS
jgi:hypothetical protein